MANAVFKTETIKLLDDSEILLKPLTIKRLRTFQELLSQVAETKSEEENSRLFMQMAALCIEKERPDLVGDLDELEDTLDMDSLNKILEVCAGLQLADPNLMAAARILQEQQEG